MKTIFVLAGTLLISLPLWGQTNFGSGNNPTAPTGTSNIGTGSGFGTQTNPNTGVGLGTQTNPNTGINTDTGTGTGTGTGIGTGPGTGTGFSPVAPTSPGNTPAATNPMGGWQGQ